MRTKLGVRIDPRQTIAPDKPLELELRLHNNALKSRRLQLGLTGPALAEKVGCNYSEYIALENLKRTPYSRRGVLKKTAAKLCAFYRVMPEDLFPPDVRAVVDPIQFVPVAIQDMARLLVASDPETLALEDEQRKVLPAAMAELSPYQAEVLRRRFGLDGEEPQSRNVIGEHFDVSPERVRQVEISALERLKTALSSRETGFALHRIVTAHGKPRMHVYRKDMDSGESVVAMPDGGSLGQYFASMAELEEWVEDHGWRVLPIEITVAWAKANDIDVMRHRCDCEVCSRTALLCPAAQSSIAEEYLERRAKR